MPITHVPLQKDPPQLLSGIAFIPSANEVTWVYNSTLLSESLKGVLTSTSSAPRLGGTRRRAAGKEFHLTCVPTGQGVTVVAHRLDGAAAFHQDGSGEAAAAGEMFDKILRTCAHDLAIGFKVGDTPPSQIAFTLTIKDLP
jgi:hypothetical protein